MSLVVDFNKIIKQKEINRFNELQELMNRINNQVYLLNEIQTLSNLVSELDKKTIGKLFSSSIRKELKENKALLKELISKVQKDIPNVTQNNVPEILNGLLEKINSFKDEYYNLKEYTSKVDKLSDLGYDFNGALEYLTSKNIPICLTPEDKYYLLDSNKFGALTGHVYENIDELVYLHKTDFMPSEDTLYVNRDGLNRTIEKDDEFMTGTINEKKMRTTKHFARNGEYKNSEAESAKIEEGKGGFQNRRYLVIQPNDEEIFSRFASHNIDTYCVGDFKLKNAYIVCPLEEKEEVQRKNPNSYIIPYSGKDIDGFGNAIISSMGYYYENFIEKGFSYENPLDKDGKLRTEKITANMPIALHGNSINLRRSNYDAEIDIELQSINMALDQMDIKNTNPYIIFKDMPNQTIFNSSHLLFDRQIENIFYEAVKFNNFATKKNYDIDQAMSTQVLFDIPKEVWNFYEESFPLLLKTEEKENFNEKEKEQYDKAFDFSKKILKIDLLNEGIDSKEIDEYIEEENIINEELSTFMGYLEKSKTLNLYRDMIGMVSNLSTLPCNMTLDNKEFFTNCDPKLLFFGRELMNELNNCLLQLPNNFNKTHFIDKGLSTEHSNEEPMEFLGYTNDSEFETILKKLKYDALKSSEIIKRGYTIEQLQNWKESYNPEFSIEQEESGKSI